MEYIVFTHDELMKRTLRFRADMLYFNNREKVVIQGIVLREEYILDHIAEPSPEELWGETYYRRV